MQGEKTMGRSTAGKSLNFAVKYGVYLILLLVIIYFGSVSSTFLTLSNAMNVLQQAAPLGIAVIGMIFVLSTASTDISAGQVMYVTGVICGVVLEHYRNLGTANTVQALLMVWLVGLSVGAAFGALNGLLVAKFNIVPFIATLATMNIAKGLGLIISKSKVYYMTELSPLAQSTVGSIKFPVVVIIQMVMVLIFAFVYHRTQFGRHILAVGNDEAAAKSVGINTVRVKFLAFLLCGITSSIAALLLAGQIANVYSSFSYGNEFTVICGAVLGGTSLSGGKGNIIPGALVGIVLIQTIMNGLTMLNASPYSYTIVKGVIIFIAVLLDSVNYKGELR